MREKKESAVLKSLIRFEKDFEIPLNLLIYFKFNNTPYPPCDR